jgi:hypothetical protein
MDKFIYRALLFSGPPALIVLAIPNILWFAFLVFVVPGFILSAMPTFFMWLLAFAVLYFPIRHRFSERTATLIAAPLVFAFFWSIASIAAGNSERAFKEAIGGREILPNTPIELNGDILLSVPHLGLVNPPPVPAPAPKPKMQVTPDCDATCVAIKEAVSEPTGPSPQGPRAYLCEALCMAILGSPGVRSVTVGTHGQKSDIVGLDEHSRTYVLLPKAQCPVDTATPDNPGGLNVNGQAAPSLQREWTLRLSVSECLVELPARQKFDMSVAHYEYSKRPSGQTEDWSAARVYDWSLSALPVRIQKIVVSDARGLTLIRKSLAWGRATWRPLVILPIENRGFDFRMGWSRVLLSNGGKFEQFNAAQILADHSSLYTGSDSKLLGIQIRRELSRLLADPSMPAGDSRLALVSEWLDSFHLSKSPISEPEKELVARLIADRRITDYGGGLFYAVRAMGEDSERLRNAIGRRIADPATPPQAIKALAGVYGLMPQGILAKSTPDEQRILENPAMWGSARSLVVRQADKGEAAVPFLLNVLRFNANAYQHAKKHLRGSEQQVSIDAARIAMDGARVGLCRLGSHAVSARQELNAMVANGLIDVEMMGEGDWEQMLSGLDVEPSDGVSCKFYWGY